VTTNGLGEATDRVGRDLSPVCPKCADLCPDSQTWCPECGTYLLVDVKTLNTIRSHREEASCKPS
jgi:hypothetical protein